MIIYAMSKMAKRAFLFFWSDISNFSQPPPPEILDQPLDIIYWQVCVAVVKTGFGNGILQQCPIEQSDHDMGCTMFQNAGYPLS